MLSMASSDSPVAGSDTLAAAGRFNTEGAGRSAWEERWGFRVWPLAGLLTGAVRAELLSLAGVGEFMPGTATIVEIREAGGGELRLLLTATRLGLRVAARLAAGVLELVGGFRELPAGRLLTVGSAALLATGAGFRPLGAIEAGRFLSIAKARWPNGRETGLKARRLLVGHRGGLEPGNVRKKSLWELHQGRQRLSPARLVCGVQFTGDPPERKLAARDNRECKYLPTYLDHV